MRQNLRRGNKRGRKDLLNLKMKSHVRSNEISWTKIKCKNFGIFHLPQVLGKKNRFGQISATSLAPSLFFLHPAFRLTSLQMRVC